MCCRVSLRYSAEPTLSLVWLWSPRSVNHTRRHLCSNIEVPTRNLVNLTSHDSIHVQGPAFISPLGRRRVKTRTGTSWTGHRYKLDSGPAAGRNGEDVSNTKSLKAETSGTPAEIALSKTLRSLPPPTNVVQRSISTAPVPQQGTMPGEYAEKNEEDEEEDDVIFLGDLPVNRWREASEACAAADASSVAGNGTSSSTLDARPPGQISVNTLSVPEQARPQPAFHALATTPVTRRPYTHWYGTWPSKLPPAPSLKVQLLTLPPAVGYLRVPGRGALFPENYQLTLARRAPWDCPVFFMPFLSFPGI